MKTLPAILQNKLAQRKANQELRELSIFDDEMVDFGSNDYLGLSKTSISFDGEKNEVGSTGSRLLSGNNEAIQNLERYIETGYKRKKALVFGSGYMANVGVLSTIPQRGDVIFYDAHVHSSIRSGIQLSKADAYKFAHNDLTALETLLGKYQDKRLYIVVESVYSMQGDSPDFERLIHLSQTYKARLIVDEAHSVGLVGEKGRGVLFEKGLCEEVFAHILTYGKAFGFHGACVLGTEDLKAYLVNFCSTFIYTTAPSPAYSKALLERYKQVENADFQRGEVCRLKSYLVEIFEQEKIPFKRYKYGAMVLIPVGEVQKTKSISKALFEHTFYVPSILSPTVPRGQECLRICVHSYNTTSEIEGLASVLKPFFKC